MWGQNNKNNAGQAEAKPAEEKTAPDEGKTFDKDTVFVCETDCYRDGTYYGKGDKVTGRECPPHFKVTDLKPEGLEGKEE